MVPMFLCIQLPSSSPGSEEGVPFRKVGVSGHTTESGKLKRRSHMVKSLESAMQKKWGRNGTTLATIFNFHQEKNTELFWDEKACVAHLNRLQCDFSFSKYWRVRSMALSKLFTICDLRLSFPLSVVWPGATHAFSSQNNSVFFSWWKLKIVASVVPFLPHFF
jgi:hypothetical protein